MSHAIPHRLPATIFLLLCRDHQILHLPSLCGNTIALFSMPFLQVKESFSIRIFWFQFAIPKFYLSAVAATRLPHLRLEIINQQSIRNGLSPVLQNHRSSYLQGDESSGRSHGDFFKGGKIFESLLREAEAKSNQYPCFILNEAYISWI